MMNDKEYNKQTQKLIDNCYLTKEDWKKRNEYLRYKMEELYEK